MFFSPSPVERAYQSTVGRDVHVSLRNRPKKKIAPAWHMMFVASVVLGVMIFALSLDSLLR